MPARKNLHFVILFNDRVAPKATGEARGSIDGQKIGKNAGD
jgi:hypothetical protein